MITTRGQSQQDVTDTTFNTLNEGRKDGIISQHPDHSSFRTEDLNGHIRTWMRHCRDEEAAKQRAGGNDVVCIDTILSEVIATGRTAGHARVTNRMTIDTALDVKAIANLAVCGTHVCPGVPGHGVSTVLLHMGDGRTLLGLFYHMVNGKNAVCSHATVLTQLTDWEIVDKRGAAGTVRRRPDKAGFG